MAKMSQLEFLKSEADRLSAKYGEDNPFVKNLQALIASSNGTSRERLYVGKISSRSQEAVSILTPQDYKIES